MVDKKSANKKNKLGIISLTPLTALSALDGRYRKNIEGLAEEFSEKSLIAQRLKVEIFWLLTLDKNKVLPKILKLSANGKKYINSLVNNFDINSAKAVKDLEATTNHDVKALEYWLANKFRESAEPSLIKAIPAIHFACTSEDINNLALNGQIKSAWLKIIYPQLSEIVSSLKTHARVMAEIPLLARTHGQPATPTTLGKELAVFARRLEKGINIAHNIKLSGKLNGATGGFNAHYTAVPGADWQKISDTVIINLGFEPNHYTTQIEPHDSICELFLQVSLINTILIDLARDLWGYIAYDYFKLKVISGEVGSSTMPHKVNPIDFENAEGNFGLANALFYHFAQKLPISRFQRDLSDSTVQRNIGSAFGYALLGYNSLLRGLNKITPNEAKIKFDLNENWEVLTEAVQTVLRAQGVADAYDLLKVASRGKKLSQQTYYQLLEDLPLRKKDKERLAKLTPETYLGISINLAKKIVN